MKFDTSLKSIVCRVGQFLSLEVGQFNSAVYNVELIEVISQEINYYNIERIHSALDMSPLAYALQLEQKEFVDSVL